MVADEEQQALLDIDAHFGGKLQNRQADAIQPITNELDLDEHGYEYQVFLRKNDSSFVVDGRNVVDLVINGYPVSGSTTSETLVPASIGRFQKLRRLVISHVARESIPHPNTEW